MLEQLDQFRSDMLQFLQDYDAILWPHGASEYIALQCNSIIEALESCCEVNDSRIDILESEIDTI